MKLHHSAICTNDVDESLRFWRDGIGFAVQFDHRFEGDWPTLFGADGSELRSVFLGDPADHDSGIVELVDFGTPAPGDPVVDAPRRGFFLLSVFADLEEVLSRLRNLGLGGEPRRIDVGGTRLAVVRDPNDVLVEVIDAGAQANLDRMGTRR